MATKLKAKAPEAVVPGHSKMLLFGAPGSGKTWFSLQFPSPYYIDTEGGASLGRYMERLKAAGGAYLGPDDGANDFDVLIDQIKALATEKHLYKTLVIDSVTKVYQDAIARESERLGDKDGWGASKKPAIARMRRLFSWVPKLDMNVVFCAHEIPVWKGEGKERVQVGMGPDCWEKVSYELDLTLHVEKHGSGFRTATVSKSRLAGFPDGERVEFQKNGADVGYANFTDRYGKDYIEAATTQTVLALPEQITKINALLEVIKVTPEEQQKWLDKANAESFEELTATQCAAIIAFLNKKIGAVQ